MPLQLISSPHLPGLTWGSRRWLHASFMIISSRSSSIRSGVACLSPEFSLLFWNINFLSKIREYSPSAWPMTIQRQLTQGALSFLHSFYIWKTMRNLRNWKKWILPLWPWGAVCESAINMSRIKHDIVTMTRVISEIRPGLTWWLRFKRSAFYKMRKIRNGR